MRENSSNKLIFRIIFSILAVMVSFALLAASLIILWPSPVAALAAALLLGCDLVLWIVKSVISVKALRESRSTQQFGLKMIGSRSK